MIHQHVAGKTKEIAPLRQLPMVFMQQDDSALPDTELFIRKTFETDPEKGFELLFKRYYQALCSHAARFVYARDVAQDLVMDVLSQFWEKQRHLSVTTSYRAYLFTLVRHAAFDHLKAELGRETLRDKLPEAEIETQMLTPYQLLHYNELALKIDEIIKSASPQCRQVFIMSRFEGKKQTAIAEELHISTKTVEGHISKMLALLRRILRHDGLLLLACWLTAGLAQVR